MGKAEKKLTGNATKAKSLRREDAPSPASLAEIPEVDLAKARGAIRKGGRAVAGKPVTLRLLRTSIGRTQVEVSEASGIAQGDLSQLERDSLEERRLSTLRRYVEALGGKLELVAAFPNGERVAIVGTR